MGFRRTGRHVVLCCLSALLAGGGADRTARAGQFSTARSYPVRRQPVEISAWERAERVRDAFEAESEGSRTKGSYKRVMDGYRAIYHETPRDLHAAEAVNAVAELLAEQGRGERDPGLLRAAIKQYEFLRTQYPGSSLRVGALLAEAQIERNDLHDAAAARERYEQLLREHPRSALAEQARAGLRSLDAAAAGGRETAALGGRMGTGAGMGAGPAAGRDAVRGVAGRGAGTQQSGTADVAAARVAAQGGARAQTAQEGGASGGGAALSPAGTAGESVSSVAAPVVRQAPQRTGPLAMVTGIRHWSTPSYTRVAIDLGDAVEYEAARVPGPDRIFFDLHGARLAPELVGKSFAVTDDGFLKRIRVAQTGGDFARIVLDVNDVTEYSAFLLPNPYRLIIDIHGRSKAPTMTAMMDAPARPTAGVPNTRAMSAGSSSDVRRLSDQPGKVEATTAPTSQPIAAVVPGTAAAAERATDADAGRGSGTTGSGAGAGRGAGGRGTELGPALGPALGTTPNATEGRAMVAPSGAATGTLTAAVAGTPVASADTTRTLASGSAAGRGRRSKVAAADAKVVGDPATPARAAVKTADGQTSLVRALGLKVNRIVIDAGHGGHDSGTLGAGGIEEKDVVLDVALRLGKLLHERLGSEVIYTRSDDTFVPLETRTAIANKAQADLFLSIHANSSPDASARGVETYYLNFTAQPDALEVAARENAVSGQSIYQLSDLVKKITLKDKIAESREFATDVEQGLYTGLARGNQGLKDRGVKKAPFVVLIGANMPSVLAEISFVTNARDAGQLREPEYRERVAESLYRGVARYSGGLSGTAARPVERAAGQ